MTTPLTLPPLPPVPPRRCRRTAPVVVLVTALALLVGGAATAWWLTRDTDDSPFAGRPRVTDERAGLSYAIPEGWKKPEHKDLIDAFSSVIGTEKGSSVLAGPSDPVPEPELKLRTERAARSNAEFFFPDRAVRLEESRPTTVSGRPAHTVALTVSGEKDRAVHLRMTVVASGEGRAGFLLGLAMSGVPGDGREVDAVLESASVEE